MHIPTPEENLNTPMGRLRNFAQTHDRGQCKILSEGENCKCPLCDLNRIQEVLNWYKEEAVAISVNLIQQKDTAVLASVNVLALDSGKRVNEILGDN